MNIYDTGFQLTLSGDKAGDSATVICRSGKECNIICLAATGCSGLDYVCESGATACNVEPSGCDGTVTKYEGIDCPSITNTANADEYMAKKYEVNKELYDAFEEHMERVQLADNDDDYFDEELFVGKEMIHIGDMEKEVIDRNEMDLIIGLGMIGFIMIAVVYECYRYKYKKDEYVEI